VYQLVTVLTEPWFNHSVPIGQIQTDPSKKAGQKLKVSQKL